ncbi:hypothetical protein E2P74_07405 [Limosilactobacillus fermentum]|uniref:hypothetical protein n=1 Tax=Limosilactobacillus fermentum TaxID=1613 RepID=UPI0010759142|nr:hypothetical protein [Limosilactobacillus fermentum]TFZ16268.1 hypothetical protein E2P74_07670 [Limosilactobacillus fermentum]TFZ16725.1 hypothetical protein E2P74_07405 [Limosilactobacillus fermentum]
MYSVVALVCSLVVNLVQAFSSYQDRKLNYKLSLESIKRDKENDAENRKLQKDILKLNHEFDIQLKELSNKHHIRATKLDDKVYIHRSLIDQMEKVYFKYIDLLLSEIKSSKTMPVEFSTECQALSSRVMIYCPEAIQHIQNIYSNNISDEQAGEEYDPKKGLQELVVNDLIPTLSNSVISVERNKASDQAD